MKKTEVLVVDDERDTCELLELALARQGMQVTTCTTAADALEKIASRDFDVVLTDLSMPETSGLEVCERVIAMRPDVPVVLITGHATLETAMGAIRAGAYDFVTKPIESKTLGVVVSRAVQHRRLREQIKQLRAARDANQSIIVGGSPAMRKVADLIERVSDSDASVLIHGETGTGKELVARAVHNKSKRREGPFVAINCAAVPHSLLESELFGHTRGAFTDARQARPGLFVKATNGTLFLDEIGEMPMGMQAKLLRALQERTVRPVGGDAEIPFDARLVAATNRDLETEVDEKRFREDLFYRINVVRINVPPLRQRGSDVLVLAQHFIERYAAAGRSRVVGMSSGAADKLLSYPWPGNVRELQNCIERAVALARYDQIGVDDLPEKIRDFKSSRVIVETEDPSELLPMDEVERRYILRVLEAVGGNKTMAAQVLGFDRRTLYRKLERCGVGDPKKPNEARE
jgi:two-component system response regulator HydG